MPWISAVASRQSKPQILGCTLLAMLSHALQKAKKFLNSQNCKQGPVSLVALSYMPHPVGTLIQSIQLQQDNWRGTPLVAQWLRIRLPMQGTRVQSLVREDPTCWGATKPVRHNYWACVLQPLKSAHLEPVLRNKRRHRREDHAPQWRVVPARRN